MSTASAMNANSNTPTPASNEYRLMINSISDFLAPVMVASGKRRTSSSLVSVLLPQIPEVYKRGEPELAEVDSARAIVVRYALHLLKSIFQTLSNLGASDSLFAPKEQKFLVTLLDLVALEGVYPNVSPGVGVPLARRAKTQITFLIDVNTSTRTKNRNLLEDIFRTLNTIAKDDGLDGSMITIRDRSRIDMISACGELAYSPTMGLAIWQDTFTELLDGIPTPILLPLITSMIHPLAPVWYRQPLTAYLSRIPFARPLGVKHIIEFLIDTSRGRAIQVQELQQTSKLIGSIPSTVSQPEAHFSAVTTQLLALLDVPSSTSSISQAAAFVIGDIATRQKTFVNRYLKQAVILPLNPSVEIDGMINLTTTTSESDLHLALTRLSLLVALPNPALVTRLVKPVLLSLWAIFTFASSRNKSHWEELSGNILRTYVKVSGGSGALTTIARNLLFDGGSTWVFGNGDLGGIDVQTRSELSGPDFNLAALDKRVQIFLTLLPNLDEHGISEVFLDVLRTWLNRNSLQANEDEEDPFQKYAGLKMLESILEQHNESIARQPLQTIELIRQILVDYIEEIKASAAKKNLLSKPTLAGLGSIVDREAMLHVNDDDDDSSNEVVTVALSLLSAILSSESMTKLKESENRLLVTLVPSLQYIAYSSASDSSLSLLAMNMSVLISSQTNTSLNGPSTLMPENKQIDDDKENYATALKYLRDPLIPVRAHGLSMIEELIQSRSSVLDIPQTIQLLISILQDEESFVYLNAIKCLATLADKHISTVLDSLLVAYADKKQQLSIDERLKIGEVLLRTVERLGEALFGDVAANIGSTMLAIASRRSRRDKERLEIAAAKAKEDAKIADIDEKDKKEYADILHQVESELGVADLGEMKEDATTQEDKWISKDGEEDLRLRASALSILGILLETNLYGMSKRVIADSLDAALHILSLETGDRTVTLRRAAVVLMMSVLKGISKEDGGEIDIGTAELANMKRILMYVQATDNDGLVREQAGGVLEGMRIIQHGA